MYIYLYVCGHVMLGFAIKGKRECKFPGCHKKCYVEDNGYVHDFCDKTHAVEFKRLQGNGSVLFLTYFSLYFCCCLSLQVVNL